PRTALIVRMRKDAALCRPAPVGSSRFYGVETFTPEQLRQDPTQPWHDTKVGYGGKRRRIQYKEVAVVHWRRGGGRRPLRVLIVAPTPYWKRKSGRQYFRDPAYLVT